jgi:hypothetical protein
VGGSDWRDCSVDGRAPVEALTRLEQAYGLLKAHTFHLHANVDCALFFSLQQEQFHFPPLE